MKFSPDQQAAIDQRSKSLLVSASAGSGKTAVLVERIAAFVLKDRLSLENILAVTFTEDAAAEMKSRLKDRFEKTADAISLLLQNQPLEAGQKELISDLGFDGQPDEKELKEMQEWLHEQITLLERAMISTIHGFCLSLLQQYYYRLGISYAMSQRVESGLLRSQALDQAYLHALDEMDDKALSELLLYMQAYGKSEKDLQEYILKFLELASSKPDAQAWMDEASKPALNDWFFAYFLKRIEALLELVPLMEEQIALTEFEKIKTQNDWLTFLQKRIPLLKQAKEDLENKDYEAFYQTMLDYSGLESMKNKIAKIDFSYYSSPIIKLEDEIFESLYPLQEHLAQHEINDKRARTFIELAKITQKLFARYKKEAGFIDFGDMEQFANTLLQDEEIAAALRDRYQTILIDEYQDTNELQERILGSFAREDNVFRVGDVKQSIYGFRQAKPELMRSWMQVQDDNHQVIHLSENYRSSKALIDFNNYFYRILMNAPGLPGQFFQEDEAIAGLPDAYENKPVRFLYSEYAKDEEHKPREAMSLHHQYRYDRLARDILEKVKEGYEFRDIAILSSSSTSHEDVAAVLETYGIPSLRRIKKGFYTNQAVLVVLSALKAIRNPYDDVSLMAVLCSGLGGVKHAQIAQALAKNPDHHSLYEAVRFEPFMKRFNELMRFRNLDPAQALLGIYGYHNFYTYGTTRQDKTNLDLLLQKAIEASTTMDLDEFLAQSTLDAKLDKTGEAYPFGKESNVVRINTIHGSKGLQYKIVYLLSDTRNSDQEEKNPVAMDSDLGISFKGLDETRRYKRKSASQIAFKTKRMEEDLSEKMRLLYVATTRAQEELVIVDSIKSIEEFAEPLSLHTLLKNRGFTSWFFHVYSQQPSDLISLVPLEHMEERPTPKKQKRVSKRIETYNQPVTTFINQIASRKDKPKWNPIPESANISIQRGNLFHSLAQNLSYPYQEKEAQAAFEKAGLRFSEKDIDQLLSLNNQEQYRKWMEGEHFFEYPYTIRKEDKKGAILSHGFMDFVSFDGDTISIVDFKTDHHLPDRLKREYAGQLAIYKQAMSAIHPDKTIHTYLYSFYNKQLIEL